MLVSTLMLIVPLLGLFAVVGLRWSDMRATRVAWASLRAGQSRSLEAFVNRTPSRPGRRLSAAACVTLAAAAATAAPGRISDAAFERLEAVVQAELDRRWQAAREEDELFPGATLGFVLPGGRVSGLAAGFADVETGEVMTPRARMPAGSIGKTFVAAVVLGLVAEGRLDLDARIGVWLADQPWFDRLPNHETITLRQLLNHSGGIIDHVFDSDSRFGALLRNSTSEEVPGGMDPRDTVRFVLDREPLFPSGAGFHYTDTGYVLVGMIIEKVSDTSYYEQVQRRFLTPLKLDMTAPLDRRRHLQLAQGYAPESRALFGLPERVVADGALVFDPSIEWTGGGLVSNSQDLARWAMALFAGDAVGSRGLDEMLNSIAVPETYADRPGRRFGYGLGINVARTDFGIAYRHGGFFPGYNSMLAYFPEIGIAVAMQINADRSNLAEHFDALVKIIVDAVAGQPISSPAAPAG